MERKLNVLFLSSWYPNKLDSHLGNFVQRHAEAVALLNHVEVLYAVGDRHQKQKYVLDSEEIRGVHTYIVYYRKSLFPLLNLWRRNLAYSFGFNYVTMPDIVHGNILQTHLLFAKKLKKERGIPFIVTEHWSGFFKENVKSLSKYKLKVAKLIAQDADLIAPVSIALKNDMQLLGIGNQYDVVGNVVDTELFVPATSKQAVNEFVFLHVSNLVALKNPFKIIDTVIDLHLTYPFVRLQIGGDGDSDSLLLYIKDKKAEGFITVFGKISLEEVADLMQLSDCFVLFSEYENLPCVLLEAMSSGVPVISSNVGGVSEIVDDKSGVLVKLDRQDLKKAMQLFVDHAVDLSSSVELHMKVKQQFSKIEIAKRFTSIYNRVLKMN